MIAGLRRYSMHLPAEVLSANTPVQAAPSRADCITPNCGNRNTVMMPRTEIEIPVIIMMDRIFSGSNFRTR